MLRLRQKEVGAHEVLKKTEKCLSSTQKDISGKNDCRVPLQMVLSDVSSRISFPAGVPLFSDIRYQVCLYGLHTV